MNLRRQDGQSGEDAFPVSLVGKTKSSTVQSLYDAAKNRNPRTCHTCPVKTGSEISVVVSYFLTGC